MSTGGFFSGLPMLSDVIPTIAKHVSLPLPADDEGRDSQLSMSIGVVRVRVSLR